jgi:hypothetical protein
MLTFTLVGIFSLVAGEILLREYYRTQGITPPYAHNPAEVLAIPSEYLNYAMIGNVSFF